MYCNNCPCQKTSIKEFTNLSIGISSPTDLASAQQSKFSNDEVCSKYIIISSFSRCFSVANYIHFMFLFCVYFPLQLMLVCFLAVAAVALGIEKTASAPDVKEVASLEDQVAAEQRYRGYGRYGHGGYYGRRGRRSVAEETAVSEDQESAEQYWGYPSYGYYPYRYGSRYGGYGRGYWRGRRSVDEPEEQAADQQTDEQRYYGRYHHGYGRRGYYGGYRGYYW